MNINQIPNAVSDIVDAVRKHVESNKPEDKEKLSEVLYQMRLDFSQLRASVVSVRGRTDIGLETDSQLKRIEAALTAGLDYISTIQVSE
jgi:hypothetical protein